MLKYVDTRVCFAEVPDEVTLCINLSNCPCHCEGCHSAYLAEDIGKELDETELSSLIESNNGISCVAFMGGDSEPQEVHHMAMFIRKVYPMLKVAWYSGRQELSKDINLKWFDFVKLGPYIEELGPLNSKTTNQRMYEVVYSHYEDGTAGYELNDITYKFHGKKD